MSIQCKIRNPQAGQELRDINRLPSIAGNDDDPRQHHSRPRSKLTSGDAEHKERHTPSILNRDGPQHAEVFWIEVALVGPASNVGERITKSDDVEQTVVELFPETIFVKPNDHAVI